jgi:hypothetical protein
VLCALCAVRACALLMLYVRVSGGTLHFMGIVCVRVCGSVRVNGTLTEDPPRPHQIPLTMLSRTSFGSCMLSSVPKPSGPPCVIRSLTQHRPMRCCYETASELSTNAH